MKKRATLAVVAPFDIALTVNFRIEVPLLAVITEDGGVSKQTIGSASELFRAKLLDAIEKLRTELSAQFEEAARKVSDGASR